MSFSFLSSFLQKPYFRLWAALLFALWSFGASAQEGDEDTLAEAPKKEVSEKVAEGLQKLQALFDAKDWDTALTVLDQLLAGAGKNSFDRALISQYKALTLLQKEDYKAAIEPLEEAVRISARHNFFEERVSRELVYYLAQLYNQEAHAQKELVAKKRLLEKSYHYAERLLKSSSKLKEDEVVFVTSVLYSLAILDEKNVDRAKIEEAQKMANEGLFLSIKPKDALYLFSLATNQQLGRNEEAIDILELLVKQTPQNQSYWGQLASLYLTLAENAVKAQDKRTAETYYIRSIVTIQRAQQYGVLNTPKDNYTLVAIYFNLEQYGPAIELLERGLRDGSIENDKNNWQLLASSYQQLKKDQKAAQVLEKAAQTFPTDGQLEYSIAQIYYSIDDNLNTYKHLKLAVERGGLEKPGGVYLFLSYVCYELRKFEEAKDYLVNASQTADAKPEDVAKLTRAVNDAIAEREAFRRNQDL